MPGAAECDRWGTMEWAGAMCEVILCHPIHDTKMEICAERCGTVSALWGLPVAYAGVRLDPSTTTSRPIMLIRFLL